MQFWVSRKNDIKYLLANSNCCVFNFYMRKSAYSFGETGTRWIPKFLFEVPIPKIPAERQKPFQTLVDYILFLKSQPKDDKSFYFEQIIDGMVYEQYFEKEIKKAGRDIIKYLQDLPEITNKMSNDKKQKIITEVFNKLYDKNSPVRNNLFYMKSIEEIKIIEESMKK